MLHIYDLYRDADKIFQKYLSMRINGIFSKEKKKLFLFIVTHRKLKAATIHHDGRFSRKAFPRNPIFVGLSAWHGANAKLLVSPKGMQD